MKRSVLGLMYLIQGMRKAGIAVDQKLQSIGLRVESLDPNAIIHPALEWDILKIIAEDIEPEQGLFIGQHYVLAGYGPLLMLLMTSPTTHTALEQGIRYQSLTHLSGLLGLKKQNDQVALCYLPRDLQTPVGQLRAHSEIAGTYKFLQDIYKMIGLEMPEIRITLPVARPEDAKKLALYQQVYGQQVSFGTQQAEFWFDEWVLNVPIPSADLMTFNVYAGKCQAELQRLEETAEQPSLIQRVQDYLELQRGLLPTMAETAQALNLPERTLRHQLQQLNSSYKQIREQLMKDRALHLVEYQEYSIEMIAELLGYSEPAAFNHAFKRWFGYSPRQYGK